ALLSLAALGESYAAGWRTGAALQASALAILPATFLMGMAFPIGLRIWTTRDAEGGSGAGARIGLFYSVNLCGSILGAVATGFLLLPALGSRGTLVLVASLSLAGGLALLVVATPPGRRALLAPALAGISVFVLTATLLPDPFTRALARRYPDERSLWRDEGIQSTVSVHIRPGGTRVLYLGGLHQANDSAEMLHVHREIGTLATTLHPAPRDVLVIGLGGGATAGAVSRSTRGRVEIVELSDSVRRAAEWFRHANDDVLRRPNVQLRVDDGRNHLLLTSRRYDVITADII
ncbi:MAG: fused MFS/spermidine synthase, partial [Acidobacteria bacterium]|nr:fused MFS/spermidine synthase [Acidobacteriota bacterium]